MTSSFDGRLVQMQINFASGAIYSYDQSYDITATGTRYSNANFGECTLRIDNISKQTRNDIISKTTPWGTTRSLANVILNAGRVSTGMFEVFRGAMVAANVTQPPDIGLTFQSATGAAALGQYQSFSMPSPSTIQGISQQVANNLTMADPNNPVTLDFQSKQGAKPIGNFACNGPVTSQVDKLNQLSNIRACVENNKLVVIDSGSPRNSAPVTISQQTGMIGVPEITAQGVRVKTLIQNNLLMFTPVNIVSTANPMANGTFIVNQIQYQIASRNTQFYWILDCVRPEYSAFVDGI